MIRTVGIIIDRQAATERFSQALALAHSNAPLPGHWLERTRSIGRAQSMTFTPMLGTAILAKATDPDVDALSLAAGKGAQAYSARSLAKNVLVPCCVRAGIDIRNTGPEPLNNQPFLRAPRVSMELNVRATAQPELEYLCDCLTQVNLLRSRSALDALAAFLRVRLELSGKILPVTLGPGRLALRDLAMVLDNFIAGDSEGGKVGQAIVTSIFDLVFSDVRTKAINDPSINWPGDVGAFARSDAQTLSAEVKQRPFTDSEVLIFAQRIREAEVHRGVVAALAQSNEPLDVEQLQFQARRLSGVELSFFFHGSALLREAVLFSDKSLGESLTAFPQHALRRLVQLEVSAARINEWAALFAGS